MKKEEKQIIYNLLKTADGYINGYQHPCFAQNVVFEDDVDNINNSDDGVVSNSEQNNSFKQEDFVVQNGFVSQDISTQSVEHNYQNISTPSNTNKIIPDNITSTPKPTPHSHDNKGITLEQLNSKIIRCTRCGLARTRNNVVPGEGVEHPDVLVVGEGPGYEEDMQGHPFVGKAGVLLDKMLNAIDLDRHTNCFIGNIVKCRPPQNRNPFPDEQDACFPFLETQIHILKPKMILCLGKVAIEKIMNQKISINANHGLFYEYNGIPVMATYHPSALLRNQELKRPAWEDLKGFKRKLDEIKNI